jgi:hypothetical protein
MTAQSRVQTGRRGSSWLLLLGLRVLRRSPSRRRSRSRLLLLTDGGSGEKNVVIVLVLEHCRRLSRDRGRCPVCSFGSACLVPWPCPFPDRTTTLWCRQRTWKHSCGLSLRYWAAQWPPMVRRYMWVQCMFWVEAERKPRDIWGCRWAVKPGWRRDPRQRRVVRWFGEAR